jgi:hypothetical protein
MEEPWVAFEMLRDDGWADHRSVRRQ